MDSIYHIDTDIECRVLHYGKEVCIASPEKDVFIELRKGKHKLTFISLENTADQFSLVFEVPENDIEDCMDVRLIPYREERLRIERDQAAKLEMIKQKEEEQRLLEIKKNEEEKRRRIQFELEQRELRARREKERIERQIEQQRMEKLNSVLSFAMSYDERFWGSWREDKYLSPFYDKDSSLNPKIGFESVEGTISQVSIPLRYRCQEGYPCNDRFHEGLAGVMIETEILTYSEKYHRITPLLKFGYIDKNGNTVIPFNYNAGTPFAYDRAFVFEADLKDENTIGVSPHRLDYLSIFDKKESLVSAEIIRGDDNVLSYYRVKYPRLRTGRWECINRRGEVVFSLRDQSDADCICIPFPFSQGLSISLWIKEVEYKRIITTISVVDNNGYEICNLNTQDKNLFYDGFTVPVFTNGLAFITTKPVTYLTNNGFLGDGRGRSSQYNGITRENINDAEMCSIHSIYRRSGIDDESWAFSKPKYR